MKYKGTFIFDADVNTIWEAREKRFENPDQFPELQKHEEIEREQNGPIIKSKRKIELAASVPPALRAILPGEMLKCIDKSEYNLETGVHKWVVTPNFKTELFSCVGYSKYTEFKDSDGKQKTRRELELEVTVKVPILGRKAEEVILEAYKKNVDKDNTTMKKMIEIMKRDKKG
jgi:hypothetical protein